MTETQHSAPQKARSDERQYDHLAPLFRELASLPDDDPARAELRDRLITAHLPVASNIAHRFANRGQPKEDLVQVATVGLINAVDRFEPDRGADFLSFAVPTIMGEVRRHFRDFSWSVRVPRRLQELHLRISAAIAEHSQDLGRAPTPSELAAHLGISREEVYEGLEAGNAYRASSVDSQGDDEEGIPFAERIGEEDPALEGVEYHEALVPLLAELPERDRSILVLRFYANLTQTQIAQRVGISQMHVSRLLAKTLQKLRDGLTT